MIYLDYAATTPLSQHVKDNIIQNLGTFGNPSSPHKLGLEAYSLIEKARETVAECIGAEPEEIFFTSGASESNTWAIKILTDYFGEDYQMASLKFEHHSIINNPKVKSDLDALPNNPYFPITQMLVNNEIGFITTPVPNIRQLFVHCDATQAIGNIPVNVKDIGATTMSFSGHKFHAPKGVGVLYIDKHFQKSVGINRLIYGGKQEKGIRGGTENVLGISALGVAIKDAVNDIDLKNSVCIRHKKYILQYLKTKNIDFIENTYNNLPNVPSILSLSFKNHKGEVFALQLENHDIIVSTGSACNSGTTEVSDTIKMLNLDDSYARGTIRVSFDIATTHEEIVKFCEVLNDLL